MTARSMFFCKEADDLLKERVEVLAKVYAIKYTRHFAKQYLAENISVILSDSQYLTSKDVMSVLRISQSTLSRRVKNGDLCPVNPEAKRNYRFRRSDVFEKEEVQND